MVEEAGNIMHVCVWGGGGGLIIMPLCICTVSWKCEVYCMHLKSLLN